MPQLENELKEVHARFNLKARITITSSYSAQPSIAKPNPFVERSINHVTSENLLQKPASLISAADQGCGKLRHLPTLAKYFRRLLFVDTTDQLDRKQKIFDREKTTVRDYLKRLSRAGKQIRVMSEREFANSSLELDIISNICVLDVVEASVRKVILQAAVRNLRDGGLLVLIVPRNDQTILVRCTPQNRHLDGHLFRRNGIATFYRNFKSTARLLRLGSGTGLRLVADLSVYRQACLIFRK